MRGLPDAVSCATKRPVARRFNAKPTVYSIGCRAHRAANGRVHRGTDGCTDCSADGGTDGSTDGASHRSSPRGSGRVSGRSTACVAAHCPTCSTDRSASRPPSRASGSDGKQCGL